MKPKSKAQKAESASSSQPHSGPPNRSRFRALIKAGLGALIAGGLVALLSHRFGLVPPLGPFLNPFTGVWKRTPAAFENPQTTLSIAGLQKPVRVVVDKDQIKHLFAENDHDLYLAQGFVLASERLWQMEFMVRTASGRLSAIMGEKTVPLDTYFTRIGLPAAANASAVLMLADPMTGPALHAYAEGVNAYISTLSAETYPIEYKILGHVPEPWLPKNAAYLLKFMAWSLSGFSQDVSLSRSAHVLGKTAFGELFPLNLPVPEPIMPIGTKWPAHVPPPSPPADTFEPSVESLQPLPTPNPANGSNNWAVSGKKSTTGLPILSNDIHLDLTLPALWYEMQLVSPTQNVYGIAFPGAPGIILGFNRSLAWGVTTGGDDILDWLQLRFRDEKQSEYLFEGIWRPVISREVKLDVRGQASRTLLLRETHFGPIVYQNQETPLFKTVPKSLAMRWAALGESNELKNFMLMNRAKTVAECRRALDGYKTPAQNFLCADNKGTIAMYHMGRFPLRWKGQGRTIGDGSKASSDWQGWLTPDEIPSVKNPARGFLSSANQPPTDQEYPFYLGWPFENLSRPTRINEILRSKQKFEPNDFVKMQRDTVSVAARLQLPPLLKGLEGLQLNAKEKSALGVLKDWDYSFEASSKAAPLAYAWYKQTEFNLWKRLLPERKTYAYPPMVKTIEILSNPNSKWFDDPRTEAKETLQTLVRGSLNQAIDEVSSNTGQKDPNKWTWAKFRPTVFQHAGHLPGLGTTLAAAGVESAIFANSGDHGPVWKLVVAVGDRPAAWGVYPGGQSGDPLSPHFQDFLPAWEKGEMKTLNFLLNADETDSRKLGAYELKPGAAK